MVQLLTIDDIHAGSEVLRYPPGVPLLPQYGIPHKVEAYKLIHGVEMIETDRGMFEQAWFFDARITEDTRPFVRRDHPQGCEG